MSAWHGGTCKLCGSTVWARLGQALPDQHRECVDVLGLMQGEENESESEREGGE